MNDTVLITTSDLSLAGALRTGFADEGYRVDLITPEESIANQADAVLLVLTGDLGDDHVKALAAQAHDDLHVPVFGVAAQSDQEWRALSLRLGLDEVFLSPVDQGELLLLGRTAIGRRRLQRLTGIVGETDEIRQTLERVVQIAPVNSTVLVTGESGTGKELVARGIHGLSPRKHNPFIAVNVAALTDTLLESELFGHEKGAFTGAIDSRKGLFELADGGTIFLDEIGEMPLATQTKLLRVLETREFLRVGGEKPIKVDVRVIAATNQDLRRLVTIGDFRRDLYYRLNVLRIELPPLRRRRADIPILVDAFVADVSETHDLSFAGISPDAMAILEAYDWPGNVRELRNLVESMVVLAHGRVIKPVDIPAEVRTPGSDGIALPVPVPTASVESSADLTAIRPELEFIFRTLVDLRVDMDELKREFESYRREGQPSGDIAETVAFRSLPAPAEAPPTEVPVAEVVDAGRASVRPDRIDSIFAVPPAQVGADGVVVYRPGMTMEEMEREAILAALDEVGGNRRKAAERLGIGERTLYRKIKKFGLE
jgi:DNA-binding NtrC family response regulator